MNLKEVISGTLNDFIAVCELAGSKVKSDEFEVVYLEAPHTPPKCLPKGKMAVYIFALDENILKVGIVGPKSNARFSSQHYNHNSSGSNLAKSLLNDENFADKLDENTVGNWIKKNCCRVNILLPASKEMPVLRLLEAFLHVKFMPRYER